MYLDVEAAHIHLKGMGFDVTLRQVRRWSTKRLLPFFVFQKSLYIEQKVLEEAFADLQSNARKQAEKT